MRQVIIVGSGPAGYTAAIYAARANLQPLLIASSVEFGGELMKTTDVENFPGFPEGIMGPDLMMKMQEQAERFGTEILYDDVTKLELDGDVKRVTVGGGDVFEARTVALDAQHHLLVPAELRGRFAHDLHAPALALGIAGAQARQIAREQGGLVAAGARADFHEGIARIVRVARQQ